MDSTTIAGAAVAAQTAQTRLFAQMGMLKQQNEAEMAIVDMLAEAASAPLPEGVGTKLDRMA
ncbi:hypothetical protein [Lutibaculum baratangense]|uniref:Motility protein n=1 Tax=Lutibaculum baratangense AMV1 TaxID=631454 RepID=V4RGK7_9HYPH|nr:hypothetical protein [Lutibaculum baratangense]ESR25291.1 hypothetical protein N177_1808 [Lutibaculum baratangense AMV1]